MSADYGFRPLAAADLPLLRGWLAQPHVRAWWGPPEDEVAMLAAALDGGEDTDMRLVETGGRPFAYLQDWDLHADPQPHLAAHAGPQGRTRVIDTLIGDPSMLGQGHAPRYLRARAQALAARGHVLLTDPDDTNSGAIAAYTRAGFAEIARGPAADGRRARVLKFQGN